MKTVTLLGATGTIGQNTLKFIDAHKNDFSVEVMTAGENVAALAAAAKQFNVKKAVIANPALYSELQNLLQGTGIETAAGDEAVTEAAMVNTDITMSAIVGAAGLKPTLAAIQRGATVALANKECLVCAGELVQKEVAKNKAKIIPVDSEHSAIFQLFDTSKAEFVERVVITASGGPFRTFSLEQMKNIKPEEAIRHPNWNMGAKISVDSATLMNKGLELIEAYYLFPLKPQQLDAIVHPQSIVHCLVEMVDGSVLAQLSNPDMITPIAVALSHPLRKSAPVKKLRLDEIGALSFEAPDEIRFPALALAKAALKAGGSAPTVLNAANEVAVGRFLKGEIGFLHIAKIVEKTLEFVHTKPLGSIQEILACDDAARRFAKDASA